MNHVITIAGLLQTVGIIIGIVAAAFGLLMVVAGGMSDAPEAGADTSKGGCTIMVCAVALIIGCIVWIIS